MSVSSNSWYVRRKTTAVVFGHFEQRKKASMMSAFVFRPPAAPPYRISFAGDAWKMDCFFVG